MVRIEGKDYDIKTIFVIGAFVLTSMGAYVKTTYTLTQTVATIKEDRIENEKKHEEIDDELSELQKLALKQEGYNAAMAAMQNADGD